MSQELRGNGAEKDALDLVQGILEEGREVEGDGGEALVEEDEILPEGADAQKQAASEENTEAQSAIGFGPLMSESLPLEEVVGALRRVREDVGQICELSAEEEKIVEAFSLSLLKLMEPLTKTLPVDPSILPRELGDIERANVVPKGELIVLYGDGRMEAIDLNVEENRDLLVSVIRDVIPKFNGLVADRRSRIEKRMDFLTSVTRELQNIADAFVSAAV